LFIFWNPKKPAFVGVYNPLADFDLSLFLDLGFLQLPKRFFFWFCVWFWYNPKQNCAWEPQKPVFCNPKNLFWEPKKLFFGTPKPVLWYFRFPECCLPGGGFCCFFCVFIVKKCALINWYFRQKKLES